MNSETWLLIAILSVVLAITFRVSEISKIIKKTKIKKIKINYENLRYWNGWF
jgi:hypothetical protein